MDDNGFNIETFKMELQTESPDYLVSKWILEKVPYIFHGDVETYIKVKLQLSELLNVDSCSIVFVGSSCTGFSLSPYKRFKTFDKKSDVDIAIVSHYFFDVAWHTLRQISPYGQPQEIQQSLKEHKERLVYWGTIATDKILGMMPFGDEWLRAISTINQNKIFENRDVKFRLYRDFESLRAYHINNFKNYVSSAFEVESKEIKL